MPIAVTCECGQRFRVKDEAAGKRVACPKCKTVVEVSEPSVFVPLVKDEPAKAEEIAPPKRPFWKDPIVLSWFLGPAVIIGGLLFYLQRESSKERVAKFITKTKAKADRLAHNKQPYDAYDTYEYLFKSLGEIEPPTAQSAAELESARSAMKLLEEAALGRRKAIADRELADATARKKAEEKASEIARLGAFKTKVFGDVWVELKNGGLRKVRGSEVRFLPEAVDRATVEEELTALRDIVAKADDVVTNAPAENVPLAWITNIKRAKIRLDALFEADAPSKIETAAIYEIVRLYTLDDQNFIDKDNIWPEILKKIALYSGVTTIDGAYEVKDIQCGFYNVYTCDGTDRTFIEWMFPVKVAQGDPTRCDLFNARASRILNASDKN